MPNVDIHGIKLTAYCPSILVTLGDGLGVELLHPTQRGWSWSLLRGFGPWQLCEISANPFGCVATPLLEDATL